MQIIIKLGSLIIIIFSFLQISISQSGIRKIGSDHDKNNLSPKKKEHVVRLGLTPSSFFNEYLGLQINGTAVLSDHFNLDLESGLIFYSLTSEENSISGYRLRAGIRYYINPIGKYNFHFSIGQHFRKTTSKKIEHFNIIGAQKNKITEFDLIRVVTGPVVMCGIDMTVSPDIILDFGVGFGFGKINVLEENTPENSTRIITKDIKFDLPGEYDYNIFIFNFKIQYLFGVKKIRK